MRTFITSKGVTTSEVISAPTLAETDFSNNVPLVGGDIKGAGNGDTLADALMVLISFFAPGLGQSENAELLMEEQQLSSHDAEILSRIFSQGKLKTFERPFNIIRVVQCFTGE
jgi:hypothetical protein